MAFMPQAASRCNVFDDPSNLPLFAYFDGQLASSRSFEPEGLTRGGRIVWRRKRCSTAVANTIASLAGIGQEYEPAKLQMTATIHKTDHADISVSILGREAWAMLELVEAGEKGCTPIDNPAPRWSHYVWLLRGHGFHVETVHEDHAGPFSGTHARYILRDRVTLDGGNLDEWRPIGVRYPQQVAA
jgi:hypothetical protein